LDLGSAGGFAEDGFVGSRLRIGAKAVVSILERDPRCAMISLDPDTAERNPAVLAKVAKAHEQGRRLWRDASRGRGTGRGRHRIVELACTSARNFTGA
jgi:hypothetical protein